MFWNGDDHVCAPRNRGLLRQGSPKIVPFPVDGPSEDH
ncbi:unnamed protein product [Spirodela intermedia]|uniref:Uncharacterized protein n=1 Tax=Spirodela intermedia TaxID=51605 RepID=A0A7I8IQ42_SPIIN|nr:unnamed protein product [Spirodela intermedia]CAA6660028.1 unnamed protein product [Spirodela intermedia]